MLFPISGRSMPQRRRAIRPSRPSAPTWRGRSSTGAAAPTEGPDAAHAGAHAFARPHPTSGMSSDPADRDADLPELLDDLEATLAELRTELREEAGSVRRESPARRSRRDRRPAPDLPRPPSVSEVLRFTEQYTLPTLISTLEATIRALELLRGTLRVIDPDRSAFEASAGRGGASTASRLGSGAVGVGREAISGVERALSELEAALADANVPEDRASSELLGEARELSAEVRERLDAAQAAGGADRGDRRRDAGESGRRDTAPDSGAGGVAIEVTDGDDPSDSDTDADDRGDEDRPEVDIDAELESIRHEVRGADSSGAAERAGTGDGSASAADPDSDAPDEVDDTDTPDEVDDPKAPVGEGEEGGGDDTDTGPAT